MIAQEPSVFSFFEYRDYLRAYFAWRKETDTAFSHRIFLKDAGIEGSAYCVRVINGQRKLSPKYIQNFIRALRLKVIDSRYFETLVRFCNEKNPDKKAGFLTELLSIRSVHGGKTLDDRKSRYFSKWYYPVVRDLVDMVDFKEDYGLLARMLMPPLKESQVKSAVKYLVETGFLAKTEDGRYHSTEETISTPPVVHSTVLTQFHKKNLELDLHAFDALDPEDRPYSSVTLSLSKQGFDKVREEIRLFRQKLLALQWQDNAPDRVCHVGFQLLPRAKVKGRSSDE